jgi:multisubunit Na+/H+ antiporter MnhG subunit
MRADLIADVLTWAGTGVAVAAVLRLPFTRGAAARLHTVAPVTVLAAPLLIAGVAARPWSSWHDVAKLAVIAVLLVATGPATVVTAGQAVERAETRTEARTRARTGGTEAEPP